MAITGVDVSHSGEDYKRMMEEAGFVDVKLYTFKYPWGAWPKNKELKVIGGLAAEMMKTGLEAYGLKVLTHVLGMPEEEARGIIERALGDMLNRKVHSYGWQ